MYLIVKVYAYNHGFLPSNTVDWNRQCDENKIIAIGAALTLAGLILSIVGVESWKASLLGDLDPEMTMRIVIPAVLCLVTGIQSISTGFVAGVMKIRTESVRDRRSE